MPTYQYACTECAEQLEAVQSFSDAALTECPACSGKLRKKFGSVGVVFKGSGFYRNDSRSGTKETPAAEKTNAKAGDSGSSSSTTSSDSSGSSSSTPSSTTSSSSSSSSTSSTSSSSSSSKAGASAS